MHSCAWKWQKLWELLWCRVQINKLTPTFKLLRYCQVRYGLAAACSTSWRVSWQPGSCPWCAHAYPQFLLLSLLCKATLRKELLLLAHEVTLNCPLAALPRDSPAPTISFNLCQPFSSPTTVSPSLLLCLASAQLLPSPLFYLHQLAFLPHPFGC